MRLFFPTVSLLLFLCPLASSSSAGSITVNPSKLYISDQKMIEVLKIINEGEDKTTLQVEAVKWSQGEAGKDLYEPTEEIVFFPKIFTINKGEESLLRVGLKNPKAVAMEASYRVFLQEIPVSRSGEMQLQLALRVSVPIFISPRENIKEWAIESAEFSDGILLVRIRNSGNSHVSVGKITARGLDPSEQEVFQKKQAGWYVLPGVMRTFGIKIPQQDCLKTKVITISVEVGREMKESKLGLDTILCPSEGEASREKEI